MFAAMTARNTLACAWLGCGLLAPAVAVAATCTLSASAVAFGSYDTIQNTPNDTTGSLTVTCTPGVSDPVTTAYVLTIAGTGSGSDAVRSLTFSTYRLYYQIYADAGRSIVWGNGGSSGAGVAGTTTSVATLTPGVRLHTAYARMPALQTVKPGLYTGSLLVTIQY